MPRVSKYLIRLKQFARFIVVFMCLFYGKAYALGLGKLEVQSNLDETLKLKIELIANEGENLKELEAVIASRADFEKVGAFYPEYLKSVEIKLVEDSGPAFLMMTSKQIIKEPFIHFLVRVNWSGGSLLREYTALIDPPVYAAEAPQPVVSPKVVGSDSSSKAQIEPDDEYQVEETLSEDDVSELQQQAPATETTYESDTSSLDDVDAAYGPVESGETLSEIATGLQQQFPELSMYQIMYVLFEENRDAFIDGNINGLLKGSVLKISSISRIRNTSMNDATSLFTEHVAKWQAKTGYIASEQPQELKVSQQEDSVLFDDEAVSEADEQQAEEIAQDDVLFDDDEQQAVEAPQDESENFVIGSSDDSRAGSSDGSNEGEILALESELSELQASLESSQLEKSELQERVSILEAQLEEVNRLMAMEVEDAELAALQDSQNVQSEVVEEIVEETPVAEVPQEVTDEVQEVGDELQEVTEEVVDTDEFQEVGDELNEVAEEVVDADEFQEVGDELSEVAEEVVDADEFQEVQDDTESKVTPVKPDPAPVNRTPADFEKPQGIVDTIMSSVISGVDSVKKTFGSLGSGLFSGGDNFAPMLGGFGVLLLSILGLVVYRNKKALEEFEISMMSIGSDSQISSRSTNAAAGGDTPSSSLESSFLTVYSESKGVVHADEIDPVAEADVYIAYGRDEQAEDVLKEGIQKHPDRDDIKLKLLKLYKRNKDSVKFERLAEELYPTDDPAENKMWQKVVSMGKTLSPNNPLFAGEIADMTDTVSEDSPAEAGSSDDIEPDDFTKTAVLKTAVLPKNEDEPDVESSLSDTIAVDEEIDQESELIMDTIMADEDEDTATVENTITEDADSNIIDLNDDVSGDIQIDSVSADEINALDLGDAGDDDSQISFDTDDLQMDAPTDTQSIDSGDTQKINIDQSDSIDMSDTQSIDADGLQMDMTDTQSIDADGLQMDVTDTQSIDIEPVADNAIDEAAEQVETASPAATLELNLQEVNLEFEDDQEEQSDIEINVVDEDEDIDLNLQASVTDDEAFSELTIEVENEDDATTQIELARVFIDLGDADGAKKILKEIIAGGNEELKADAEALLSSIK